MKRREFFKMAASVGLGVTVMDAVLSPALTAPPPPAVPPYEGPLYLMIKADGGWDATCLCDPKGNELNQDYGVDDIQSAGNILYSPKLGVVSGGASFFQKYRDDLLVINGIDMSTNSHNPGKRYTWTGRLDNAGYPTFAALVSAIKAPNAALSHISFGYGASGGVVPLSRFTSNESLRKLSRPHESPRTNYLGRSYHDDFVHEHMQMARQAREQLLRDRHNLPAHRESMDQMFLTKLSLDDFKKLQAYLPPKGSVDNELSRISLVFAAYQAGLCVSANMSLGGFDTHKDNDAEQRKALIPFLQRVDSFMEYADTLGIRERIVVVLGSEFSRTPKYNSGRGKDHWSVGSMMMMGPGIRGNRVLGKTDEGQRSLKVDPTTLTFSEAQDAIALKPEHIHHALRRFAGVEQHPYATTKFRIEAEELPIFS